LDLGNYGFGTVETTSNIVFKAGDNFLVSEDGALYAKSGRIGNMTIEDISSKLATNLFAIKN
jgi:hypothetical protein